MNMNDLNVIHSPGRNRQILQYGSKTKRAKRVYYSACTCGNSFRDYSREGSEARRDAHIQRESK